MQISLKIVFKLTFELWRNEWGAMHILKMFSPPVAEYEVTLLLGLGGLLYTVSKKTRH